MVHEIEFHVGLCTDAMELAWDSLSPLSLSLSAPSPLMLFLSRQINKLQKNFKVHFLLNFIF